MLERDGGIDVDEVFRGFFFGGGMSQVFDSEKKQKASVRNMKRD